MENIDTVKLKRLLVFVALAALLISGVLFLFIYLKGKESFVGINTSSLSRFQSSEEFSAYIQRSQANFDLSFSGRGSALTKETLEAPVTAPMAQDAALNRTSETNVQVKGIDEPDIVKTDGQKIYISQSMGIFYPLARGIEPSFVAEDRLIYPAPEIPQSKTQVVNAFPPTNLAKEGEINTTGEMLLFENRLVSLAGNKLTGIDVSDPKNPKEAWNLDFENNYQVASRAKDGQMIVVMQNSVNVSTPCPIPLFKMGTNSITVPCTDIYYPNNPAPVDSTYTVVKINPQNGEVTQKVSFVGNSGTTVVYVSQNSVYVSFTYPGDFLGFYERFVNEKAADLLPRQVVDRIALLKTYDISNNSKLNELMLVLQQYNSSLSKDDQLKLETELTNRMTDFLKSHSRELETTGIAKVDIGNMSLVATGAVPGQPLNQFSMDEHNGDLRIATTTGNNFWWFNTQGESTNDVYVLGSNLSPLGKILDLGVGERIFSARFIGDKVYLVTFKQIDPFFVLDLSNPRNPVKAGELKIPGYSSYLHPLTNNQILGVGQENGLVKLAIFDVSNPNNPTEVSKYNLNEYWTEVSNNHHAFLQDEKHKVFFLPGGQGGYIFSYETGELKLVRAISGFNVQRAIYLNDYLYVISSNKIIVLDENNWTEVKSLTF